MQGIVWSMDPTFVSFLSLPSLKALQAVSNVPIFQFIYPNHHQVKQAWLKNGS